MITYLQPRRVIFSMTPPCTPPHPCSSSQRAGCQARVTLNRKCVRFKRRVATSPSGWTSLMKWLCVIYGPLLKGWGVCVHPFLCLPSSTRCVCVQVIVLRCTAVHMCVFMYVGCVQCISVYVHRC